MHLFRLLLLFVVLVEKLIVLRKAERNQFADLGAMTEPGQKFFFRADAAGTVKTETVRFVEELNVRQSSVFVLLQPHAAASGQSRYFLAFEDQQLAVGADDGHHVTGNFQAEHGRVAFGNVHDFTSVAGLGNDVVFVDDKAVTAF